MNKELTDAIAAQDSKVFWSIVIAISVSTLVSAIVNYLFNTRLAESVRKKGAEDSKRYESKIKIPERTDLLQLEKRITAIDEISELQRLMQEFVYDHQSKQHPDKDMREKAVVDLKNRMVEINKHLRSMSIYFVVNHTPYLEKYQEEWLDLGNSIQQFLDTLTEARAREDSGGSGQYTLSTDSITEASNSLKAKIFSDAASYE